MNSIFATLLISLAILQTTCQISKENFLQSNSWNFEYNNQYCIQCFKPYVKDTYTTINAGVNIVQFLKNCLDDFTATAAGQSNVAYAQGTDVGGGTIDGAATAGCNALVTTAGTAATASAALIPGTASVNNVDLNCFNTFCNPQIGKTGAIFNRAMP